MKTIRLCPACAAPHPKDSPEGLCPQCVLNAGVETQAASSSPLRASALAPEINQQFGGYQIVRLLGKGGMGAVYEAEHLESGRRVALKVLTHSLDSPETRKRFLREGRLAASVNHPNSVYIYGTEEIDSTPVITMELVSGGTLQGRVKQNGPLPTKEAVDAILQVIGGLEAAAKIGVLHRDVKPSNCFIETDGTVKVGDFGLSISTLARGETNLTVSGAFLGTPAYSSPEQLRGDELDVRSDIYAVGVTLYYLLTGKTPFRSENMVQLLATVLEKPAESPAKWRPEIPQDLAKAVLRCLAKPPAQRFKHYDELRQALSPFSASAGTPATIGLRFLAGCLDFVAVNMVSVLVILLLIAIKEGYLSDLTNSSKVGIMTKLSIACVLLLYFSIAEGVWGAALGKKACRLRVVGSAGGTAGFPRALLRAFIFPTLMFLMTLVYPFVYSLSPASAAREKPWLSPAIGILSLAAIFSTARRKNGFAALHDLASGTRVVLARSYEARTRVAAADGPQPATENLAQIGPYHILSSLSTAETHELLLGYDTRLLRKVWILKYHNGEVELSSSRRELSRRARLRWLAGKRTPDESWDAFEAVPGKPLLDLLQPPQPWNAVRNWLHDLTEEINAGIKDQSLPAVLDLDRIWVGTDGQAKLLEFPAPGVPTSLPARSASFSASAQPTSAAPAILFLKQVALTTLHGGVVGRDEAGSRPIHMPLPLHARTFLTKLSTFSNLETLSGDLKTLLELPAVVISTRRRLGLWLTFWLVFLGLSLSGFFASLGMMDAVQAEPDLELLRLSLARIAALQKAAPDANTNQAEELRALEIYTAARFRKAISNPFVWTLPNVPLSMSKGLLLEEWHEMAKEIVAAHPQPSESEITNATAQLKEFLAEYHPWIPRDLPGSSVLRGFLFMATTEWFQFLIFPSLIGCVLLRGAPLLQVLGIALVTKDGSKASPWRALSRALITWSPILIMPLVRSAVRVGAPEIQRPIAEGLHMLLALFLITVGMIAALWTPQRALQDRIVGTWLVPK